MGHETKRIYGLPSVVSEDSVVLILGTLPGQKSLAQRKYYADPTNKFWDILFSACGESVDRSDAKIESFLKTYKIALWDVLSSAVRESSSD